MSNLISVIMAVHNGGEYIAPAVESVLNQTHKNLELIVFDDASTDGTGDLLEELSVLDNRLIVVRNKKNSGLAVSLNSALDIAKGDFIARMDGDDIASLDRMEKQYKFLVNNSEFVIVGSDVQCFDASIQKWKYPKTDGWCYGRMFFSPPFAHPAVMVRRSVFFQNNIKYDPRFKKSQDYDLWERIHALGKMANLPEFLLNYRVHDMQASQSTRNDQIDFHLEVCARIWLEKLEFKTNRDTAILIAGISPKLAKEINWIDYFSFMFLFFKFSFKNKRLPLWYACSQIVRLLKIIPGKLISV
nr:glycosyltransferase family A protein [uncultured Albidiferax sp.]